MDRISMTYKFKIKPKTNRQDLQDLQD